MKRQNPQASLLALAVAAAFAPAFAETVVTTSPVEVVGTTPLAGVGVPREHLPANVVSLDDRRLEEIESLNIAEQMLRQVPAVTVNEMQGNPYQADLNYRGFTASPLLGTAQGLSIYLDGVRINEPFGDTVNWDLIPNSAIAGLDLIPGSNPAFGLNTLGGAISMRTKSGFSHPGGKVEVSGGSFGRTNTELEYGGNNGTLGWYAAGDWFREDGWRDHSPSDVKQFFGKLSFRNAAGEADLSLLSARSRLIGNGPVPLSMLGERREAIFTHPDETRNDLIQLSLNGKLWLSDTQSLSGSVYHRRTKTRTLNGDLNNVYKDEYALDPTFDESGAHNRTRSTQHGNGVSGQWNLSTERHSLAVGTSYDHARMSFRQTVEVGVLNDSRGISQLADPVSENQLHGTTETASLFVTDTWALTKSLHLTASARYNASHVTTFDELNRTAPNLDGDHKYRKLNPALGLAWDVTPVLNAYAGFSQGNRIPTPIELGCADPANPCSLPNSMAADPYLKQVISRTLEAGLRGKLTASPVGDMRWNAGLFRTLNTDDILFVGTSSATASQGYFTNYGKTRRQGLELGANGSVRSLDWFAAYNWLHATFQSEACVLAENNSTAGSDAACNGNEIRVKKGNHLSGLPEHSFKLGLAWHATDALRLGGDMQAFSGQYVRGNENNQADGGRLGGYAVINLNAEARLGGGWQVFAKVNNVFDRKYATAGLLGENPFVGGSFQPDPANWRSETFVSPGAPRAAWLGIRYVFGGK